MSEEVDQTDHTSDSGDGRPLSIPDEISVLPLRDTVLFPDSFMPLAVAREASIRLIDKALAEDQLVGVFT